ncbi:hypothetical protein ACFWJM_16760 [Streptomyces sp. NPDC127077]|uniref:hypothetical protein n=1 Tax=Streptomyces sp. NPDC127077 TaxID=3347131 RepID=UPI0036475CD7
MGARYWLLELPKYLALLLIAAGLSGMLGIFSASLGPVLGFGYSVDPRDYDRSGDGVASGDGSLEAVLAHYEIAMPCLATGVRFYDSESLVGSEGTLGLRFDTSRACFESFARDAGLSLNSGSVHTWQADDEFDSRAFLGDAAQGHGWDFPVSHTYLWGEYTASDAVSVQVTVDRQVSGDTAYLIGEHR